ncbi:MAG: DUF6527 family protein [Hyphomicrobiaceae bacterium]
MKSIALKHVIHLPRQLEPGILYVSQEYAVAGHLCACGCGNKVITPLGPAEWSFSEKAGLASLRPSIGNWQLACRSHYVISSGRICWAPAWSDIQVKAGREIEQARREAHYRALDGQRTLWGRLRNWVLSLFK